MPANLGTEVSHVLEGPVELILSKAMQYFICTEMFHLYTRKTLD